MMNSAGYIYNHGVRTFRLCYKNPGENQITLELRKQLSLHSHLNGCNKESLFSRKNSISSFIQRCKKFNLRDLTVQCNEKLAVLGEILTQQFNFYAAQRLRRASQILHLYRTLYTERSLRNIISQFMRSLQGQRKQQFSFLLGVALFSWEREKVTDDEIQKSIYELDSLRGPVDNFPHRPTVIESSFSEKLLAEGWEAVIQKDCIQLWRKAFPNSYLYEYKIFGTFFDVPARAFFSVQTDIEYRKKWDKLVIKLDVIDQEKDCEVVHWVMHYPCPMYSREYVYIRRYMVDAKTNTMVLVSRAVDHPSCPTDKKYVRVTKYSSKMVIRPHRTFDENGFDYILTYFDDPQAAFPSAAYNWMASSGVPDFVERLHDAARELHYQQKRNRSAVAQSRTTQECPAGDVEYAYI